MEDYKRTLINSIRSTIINSEKNNLIEKDRKVLDCLGKLDDFLDSYFELDLDETNYFINLINQLAVGSSF